MSLFCHLSNHSNRNRLNITMPVFEVRLGWKKKMYFLMKYYWRSSDRDNSKTFDILYEHAYGVGFFIFILHMDIKCTEYNILFGKKKKNEKLGKTTFEYKLLVHTLSFSLFLSLSIYIVLTLRPIFHREIFHSYSKKKKK